MELRKQIPEKEKAMVDCPLQKEIMSVQLVRYAISNGFSNVFSPFNLHGIVLNFV